MHAIGLPLIQAEGTTVDSAIDTLRNARRSGLVVEGVDGYQLMYWRHLLEAKDRQLMFVAQIADGYSVRLLGEQDMREHSLDLVRPMRTVLQYEAYFLNPSQQGVDYALAGATEDSALVVTRREDLRYFLATVSTGGFRCNGAPLYHFFPDPAVVVGQKCPKYPECTLPGGGWPVISAIV